MTYTGVSIKEFVKHCIEDTNCSPDVGFLSRKWEAVPVFFYGTEKTNFSDAVMTRNATFLGSGFTTKASYVMKITKDHEPVCLEQADDPYCAKVYGEIYSVPTSILPSYDLRFTNQHLFNRRLIHVKWSPPGHTVRKGEAIPEYISEVYWYLGCSDYWGVAFGSDPKHRYGDRFKRSKDENGRYFVFTSKDDAPNKKPLTSEGFGICM